MPNYVTIMLLPTLLLWLTVSATRIEKLPIQRELFGSDTYYLDVRLERKGNFSGYFATSEGELAIKGQRYKLGSQWHYDFVTSKGQFSGELTSVQGRCEPELKLHWTEGAIIRQGKLRAAFCGSY